MYLFCVTEIVQVTYSIVVLHVSVLCDRNCPGYLQHCSVTCICSMWQRGLRGWVVRALRSKSQGRSPLSARVRISAVPLCEKVCQFSCGRSVVSPQVHCAWALSSTNKNWTPPYNWKIVECGGKQQIINQSIELSNDIHHFRKVWL